MPNGIFQAGNWVHGVTVVMATCCVRAIIFPHPSFCKDWVGVHAKWKPLDQNVHSANLRVAISNLTRLPADVRNPRACVFLSFVFSIWGWWNSLPTVSNFRHCYFFLFSGRNKYVVFVVVLVDGTALVFSPISGVFCGSIGPGSEHAVSFATRVWSCLTFMRVCVAARHLCRDSARPWRTWQLISNEFQTTPLSKKCLGVRRKWDDCRHFVPFEGTFA